MYLCVRVRGMIVSVCACAFCEYVYCLSTPTVCACCMCVFVCLRV